MKIYCINTACGAVNEYQGVKPTECQFCSEPFVKKVVATKVTPKSSPSNARRVDQRRQEETEAAETFDESEIPSSFDIITQNEGKMTFGAIIEEAKKTGAPQSEPAREPIDPTLAKTKDQVLDKMLHPARGR